MAKHTDGRLTSDTCIWHRDGSITAALVIAMRIPMLTNPNQLWQKLTKQKVERFLRGKEYKLFPLFVST